MLSALLEGRERTASKTHQQSENSRYTDTRLTVVVRKYFVHKILQVLEGAFLQSVRGVQVALLIH